MEAKELETQMRADILARLENMGIPQGGLLLVGHLADAATEQEVWLWMAKIGEGEGPYDYLSITYIYNFWGDACSRGELADVIVFNGVDGYKAVDPAEEMFPAEG